MCYGILNLSVVPAAILTPVLIDNMITSRILSTLNKIGKLEVYRIGPTVKYEARLISHITGEPIACIQNYHEGDVGLKEHAANMLFFKIKKEGILN